MFCKTWRGKRAAKRCGSIEEALDELQAGTEALCLTGGVGGIVVDTEFINQLGTALKRNETLRLLQLDGNGLQDDAAVLLGEVLEVNTAITSLDLDSNSIGDQGISRVAQALRKNSRLQELQLQCNQVSSSGGAALGKALKVNATLRELSLHGNPLSDAGAEAIANALSTNNALRCLSLHGTSLSDVGATRLSLGLQANTTLCELSLGCNQIADSGAGNLAKMLSANSTLQELRLEKNRIGEPGAHELAKVLASKNRTLLELWLVDNPFGVEGLKHMAESLRTNTVIKRLGVSISKERVMHKDLVQDFKQQTAMPKAVRAVQDGSNQLNLADEQIPDDVAEALAKAIEASTLLFGISLSKCQLSDKGASRLAEALETSDSLFEVSLSGNEIGDVGLARLKEVMEMNNTTWDLIHAKEESVGTNEVKGSAPTMWSPEGKDVRDMEGKLDMATPDIDEDNSVDGTGRTPATPPPAVTPFDRGNDEGSDDVDDVDEGTKVNKPRGGEEARKPTLDVDSPQKQGPESNAKQNDDHYAM